MLMLCRNAALFPKRLKSSVFWHSCDFVVMSVCCSVWTKLWRSKLMLNKLKGSTLLKDEKSRYWRFKWKPFIIESNEGIFFLKIFSCRPTHLHDSARFVRHILARWYERKQVVSTPERLVHQKVVHTHQHLHTCAKVKTTNNFLIPIYGTAVLER